MTITVYTKPACGPCIATKRALESKEIPFNEASGPDNVEMLHELGYMESPVVIVRDDAGEILDHWSKFRLDKIEALAAA